MVEKYDIPAESNGNTPQSHDVMSIKVNMKQGEHTGQPLYTNFTSVQAGQGVIIVDFGFLDPHTMQTINQLIRSGNNSSTAINAKMSCRIVINIDAANQLIQQLNQILRRKSPAQTSIDQQQSINQAGKAVSNEQSADISPSDEKSSTPKTESNVRGFKFPWSKKTH